MNLNRQSTANPSLGCIFTTAITVSLIVFILLLGAAVLRSMQFQTERGAPVALQATTAVPPTSTEAVTQTLTATVTPTVTPQPTQQPTQTPLPTATPSSTVVAEATADVEAGADTATSSQGVALAYDPAVVAEGEALFPLCAACHGPDARGLPNLGKNLVESEFVQSLSDQELLDFIKVGRPIWDPLNTTGMDMPPRGGNPALTDEQILSLIAYIRSLHAASEGG